MSASKSSPVLASSVGVRHKMVKEVIIKSKEKKYCGFGLDELKTMPLATFAKYIPSRSRRSVLRHPEVIDKFVKSCEDEITRKKKIRTHFRDLVIVPKMVGMIIGIYNGKSFEDVLINFEMLGHRLGEFTMTRQRVTHSEAGIGATRGSRAAKK
ncbi:MAG: ribosomal protein S19 family protein [Nanoarchaeota archaeon]